MAQCTAKSKRTGERCKNAAVPGRNVCHIHGGKTPRGFALPQTVTGRYSKHLPTRLAARYQEAQADAELLNLREEVALTDALLTEMIARLDTGESGGLWKALGNEVGALLKARADNDNAGIAAHLNAVVSLVRQGAQEQDITAEIRQLLEARRRLVESERKRLVEMQMMVSVEASVMLLSAFLGVVSEHVKDRDAIAAIGRDMDRLLARPDPAVVG